MERNGTVLLVGHCGPDAFALQSAVRSMAPEATVEQVNSRKALDEALPASRLLLVNRVLDGDFGTGSGIELIRELAGSDGFDLVLVSNLADAQAEAEAAGALPGFGKSDLYSERMRGSLEAGLG